MSFNHGSTIYLTSLYSIFNAFRDVGTNPVNIGAIIGSLVILLHFTFQALQAGKLGDNLVKIADEQAQAVVNKNHIDLIDRSLNEKGIWFSCYVQINFFNLTFPGKVCPSQGYENTLHVGVENLALIQIIL